MHLSLAKKDESLYAPVFSELIRDRSSSEPVWLRLLRQKSFDRFEQIGFPTVKDEDWKYTNVAAIAKETIEPVWPDRQTRQVAGDLSRFVYPESRNSTFVFVDGIFQPDLTNSESPSEFSVMSFADALASSSHAAIVREHLERDAAGAETGFDALNTAFSDGVLFLIPAGAPIEAPIHLLFVVNRENGWMPAVFPRVLVVAEPNSSATVVESYVGGTTRKYLTNALVEVVVSDGAKLEHYKVQRESAEAFHIASTRAEVGVNAKYSTTSINLGAALSRHDIAVTFEEEGGECSVDGLYLISDEQHSDTHSVIDHRQPHCTSRQLYKGVLDGKSHAVFNGKVFVRHGAQQTDAQQTNKNLLLSENARVDTKPQLEIFADDVKCAHGAAVGQLSEDEVFYLESRGINPTLARNLLTYGFAKEVIERIKIDSIKKELDEVVLNRLHSGLEID